MKAIGYLSALPIILIFCGCFNYLIYLPLGSNRYPGHLLQTRRHHCEYHPIMHKIPQHPKIIHTAKLVVVLSGGGKKAGHTDRFT
jgi:hypothetical protein